MNDSYQLPFWQQQGASATSRRRSRNNDDKNNGLGRPQRQGGRALLVAVVLLLSMASLLQSGASVVSLLQWGKSSGRVLSKSTTTTAVQSTIHSSFQAETSSSSSSLSLSSFDAITTDNRIEKNVEFLPSLLCSGITDGEMDREQVCRQAFLRGVEPYARSSNDSPLWQCWTSLSCDSLFCHGRTKEGKCQWTRFAIQTLLGQQSSNGNSYCNSQDIEQFYPDEYWARYQFADHFRGSFVYQDIQTSETRSKKFEGSLIDEYHQHAIQNGIEAYGSNYTLLHQIVKQRLQSQNGHKLQLPAPDALVIHLRLGDVVDAAVESVEQLLLEQCFFYRMDYNTTRKVPCCQPPWKAPHNEPWRKKWNQYVRPLHFFAGIDYQKYSSVVIMGAAHQGQVAATRRNATKSCLYVRALQTYIQRFQNVNITLRLGGSPDDDIIFASQAKAYLGTGGGYSKVIRELVLRFGGETLA